ncbi:hypothetical protein [Glycomyces harbinensis]|uniref:Secreted protein n=1 Tax=Glycomyces harbinensis TaxID=58114 RepID=A0A1G7DKH5_9ACTN|nr:hypothetical protein [Glycomyces harbinensis]SDE52011.1 hypothetical protein SAMN05216270_1269 [Glycomyces harbinensis]
MTTRSRLWATLAVPLAMVLAAGLGVAGPAAADTGTGEPAAAEEAELGAVLDVQYEPQPDGYIEVTEYENATEVTAVAAACTMTVRAYKPTKSGTNLRGEGYFKLSGCGSSPFKVIFSLEIYVNGYWLEVASYDYSVTPPASGYPRVVAPCKRGSYSTELLVQRGSEDAYQTSDILNVSSC